MTITNIAAANTVNKFVFSICTLVTNWDEYNEMRQSFERKGFTADCCEYLIADNSNGNVYDAYTAINRFFSLSSADYTILIHQDTICYDTCGHLLDILKKMDAVDDKWAVCGNAGGVYPGKKILYLNELGIDHKYPGLPLKVDSLDENFMVVKNKARLSVSNNLSGFHLYGTDICLIARFLGYTAYIIPFYIRHNSNGNFSNLYEDQAKFIGVYQKKFINKIMRTTCLKFYLSNNDFKNKVYNKRGIFFLVKAFYKLKIMVTKEIL